MKRVYLVRHGQTNANINHTVQGPDELLNDLGIKQANIVARRLQNIDFEKLVVSDYKRTQMTAEPVVEVCGVPAELSPLFREEKKPSSYIGKSQLTAEGKQFSLDFIERATDPDWRIEDMETPQDILNRAKEAVKFLEDLPDENITVISHGDFIKQVLAYLMLDKTDDVASVVKIRSVMKSTNTGISMIHHNGSRWRVLAWNDHAHFAE